jgi:hypothetical protein
LIPDNVFSVPNKDDAIAERHHHNRSDTVPVSNEKSVHSSMYTDEGKLLHPHDFIVSTGHDITLGHSDAPKYEIHSRVSTPENMCTYETESMHADQQVYPDKNHLQHGQDHIYRAPKEFTRRSSSTASPETWSHMVHALKVLKDMYFDRAETDMYLPMFEEQRIHPDMEDQVYHFYKHLIHRLTPEYREKEPVPVVAASLEFIEAYETLKGIII